MGGCQQVVHHPRAALPPSRRLLLLDPWGAVKASCFVTIALISVGITACSADGYPGSSCRCRQDQSSLRRHPATVTARRTVTIRRRRDQAHPSATAAAGSDEASSSGPEALMRYRQPKTILVLAQLPVHLAESVAISKRQAGVNAVLAVGLPGAGRATLDSPWADPSEPGDWQAGTGPWPRPGLFSRGPLWTRSAAAASP